MLRCSHCNGGAPPALTKTQLAAASPPYRRIMHTSFPASSRSFRASNVSEAGLYIGAVQSPYVHRRKSFHAVRRLVAVPLTITVILRLPRRLPALADAVGAPPAQDMG